MTDPSRWVKASKSGSDGICVEMRRHEGAVEVRDTKAQGKGPSLRLAPVVFAALMDTAKGGHLDRLL